MPPPPPPVRGSSSAAASRGQSTDWKPSLNKTRDARPREQQTDKTQCGLCKKWGHSSKFCPDAQGSEAIKALNEKLRGLGVSGSQSSRPGSAGSTRQGGAPAAESLGRGSRPSSAGSKKKDDKPDAESLGSGRSTPRGAAGGEAPSKF